MKFATAAFDNNITLRFDHSWMHHGLPHKLFNMPNTHTSKKLPFIEAERLGDLASIRRDLEHCLKICDYFLGAERMIGEDEWDRVYLDSLFIAYRRAFTTGRRFKISLDDIKSHIGLALEVHAEFIDIADKHVAHAVNRMEESYFSLGVVLDEGGQLVRRGGWSEGGHGVLGPSIMKVEQLRGIIECILGKTIPKISEDLKKDLQQKVDQLSNEQILALPCGIPTGTRGIEHLSMRPRVLGRQSKE